MAEDGSRLPADVAQMVPQMVRSWGQAKASDGLGQGAWPNARVWHVALRQMDTRAP